MIDIIQILRRALQQAARRTGSLAAKESVALRSTNEILGATHLPDNFANLSRTFSTGLERSVAASAVDMAVLKNAMARQWDSVLLYAPFQLQSPALNDPSLRRAIQRAMARDGERSVVAMMDADHSLGQALERASMGSRIRSAPLIEDAKLPGEVNALIEQSDRAAQEFVASLNDKIGSAVTVRDLKALPVAIEGRTDEFVVEMGLLERRADAMGVNTPIHIQNQAVDQAAWSIFGIGDLSTALQSGAIRITPKAKIPATVNQALNRLGIGAATGKAVPVGITLASAEVARRSLMEGTDREEEEK